MSGILGQSSDESKYSTKISAPGMGGASAVDSSDIAAGEVWTANPPNRCNSEFGFFRPDAPLQGKDTER
jgi:hypothetical protein